MKTVTIHAAKTNLSQLIAEVEAGAEIVLARGKTPVARLTPYAPKVAEPRKPGAWKGQLAIGEEINDPLPEEELRLWE